MSNITRKSYLIMPSFQLKLGLFLILLLFIGSFLHAFFLYNITSKNIAEGFLSAHNRLRSTWDILKPAVVLTNGLSFLILSLAFSMATVLISHRLIGPLFKFKARLHDIATGRLDLPPVQLRKGDEGQIISEAINEVQTAFRCRFQPLVALQKQWDSGIPPTEAEIRTALERAVHDLQLDAPSSDAHPEPPSTPA